MRPVERSSRQGEFKDGSMSIMWSILLAIARTEFVVHVVLEQFAQPASFRHAAPASAGRGACARRSSDQAVADPVARDQFRPRRAREARVLRSGFFMCWF